MILRERFGMTYQQAYLEEEAWYVDMLLESVRREQQAVLASVQREAEHVAELERTEQALMQDMKAAGLDPMNFPTETT